MSVEHHVRNEVRFKNVSNWKVLALQLEEEVAEGPYCLPLEIQNSKEMVFANLYSLGNLAYKSLSLCYKDMEFKGYRIP